MEKNLEGLKGLKGLSGLSSQERAAWSRLNADKLRGKTSRFANILYDNQQYIKKFGIESFNTYNKDQRDKIYKSAIARETITELYSPYTDKKDKLGNFIIDKNKGVGNAELFNKIYNMSPDSQIELAESGWKTTPQIESMLKEEHKKKQDYISNSSAWAGASPWAQSAVAVATSISEPIHEELSRSRNNKIFERIYNKDLKKKEDSLQPGRHSRPEMGERKDGSRGQGEFPDHLRRQ